MDTAKSKSGEDATSEQMAGYLSQIAHLDMPLSAKIELIEALHRMMSNFVDRAWGDDPVQHVHEMRARDETRRGVMVGSDKDNSKTDKTGLTSAFTSPAAGRRRKERK